MRAEPSTQPRRSIAARAFAAAVLASALLAAAPLAARRAASQTASQPASQRTNGTASPGASHAASQPANRSAQADADPTLSAIVRPAEAAELGALPEDPGKTLVAERCLLCHSAGMIAQQHKDAAAWGRTVTQMRTWGSPIQDADQAALVTYLADHFGPVAPRR